MSLDDEHEKDDHLSEDVFYPDRGGMHKNTPRTESKTFEHTKASGHAAKRPCMISGHVEGAEYHHFFLEWALVDAVDWQQVKDIATGKVTHLPVLDLENDQPTGDVYRVEASLIYVICKLAEVRGFDWESFDPSKPETFVDSMANMMVLNMKFHRHKDHGIHCMSFPEWVFQAWPRKKGFIYTPDEEHRAISAPAMALKHD